MTPSRFAYVVLTLALACPSAGGEHRAFVVRGGSMSPALRPGHHLVVEAGRPNPGHLARGDLVVVRFRSRSRPMVKRVAALPGDRIAEEKDGFRVLVEGGSSWPAGGGGGSKALRAQLRRSEWKVPPGTVILLSDNLAAGHDSRRYGLVSLDRVEGRVVRIIPRREEKAPEESPTRR